MLDWVAYILLDVVCYATARFLLPLLSFGQIRAERPTQDRIAFNWLGVGRDEGGQRVLDWTVACWFGLFIWIGVLTAVVLAVR